MYNGNALPDKAIEKPTLAHIGPADESHVAVGEDDALEDEVGRLENSEDLLRDATSIHAELYGADESVAGRVSALSEYWPGGSIAFPMNMLVDLDNMEIKSVQTGALMNGSALSEFVLPLNSGEE